MVAGQVWVAQGGERTEEAWTWVMGGAPPGSHTQKHTSHILEQNKVWSNDNFSECT